MGERRGVRHAAEVSSQTQTRGTVTIQLPRHSHNNVYCSSSGRQQEDRIPHPDPEG